MIETTQYPYSLKFSLGTLAVIVILMLIMSRNLTLNNIALVYVVYGFFALIFILLITVLVMKRLVPALKGDIALQLDEEGLSDYIKDVSIQWKDIREIHLIQGRSASIMRVDLKWESDHGNQVAIYLRWVKGKDKEIYETTLAYFERHSPGWPE